jgi:hypothetical protein
MDILLYVGLILAVVCLVTLWRLSAKAEKRQCREFLPSPKPPPDTVRVVFDEVHLNGLRMKENVRVGMQVLVAKTNTFYIANAKGGWTKV